MEAELSVSVQFCGSHRHVNFGPFFFVLRSKCASKCALLHRRGDGVRDSGAGISGLNTAYTYSLWLIDLSAHGVPPRICSCFHHCIWNILKCWWLIPTNFVWSSPHCLVDLARLLFMLWFWYFFLKGWVDTVHKVGCCSRNPLVKGHASWKSSWRKGYQNY